jgi:threonine/homoserine/homoserine lactone efflux protein
MSTLIIQTVPLALAAAISPVLFLLQLNTVTGVRPIARGSALTAGAAFVLIAISSACVALGVTALSGNDSLQAAIKIGFGLLLLAVGLRALLHPKAPKAEAGTAAKPASIGRSFLAGTAGMASNITTFALYIPALALIADSDLPLGQVGMAALIILVITLTVAWVPLAIAVVVPGASTSWLPRLGAWMTRNDRWVQVTLGVGFGLLLLVKGIEAL